MRNSNMRITVLRRHGICKREREDLSGVSFAGKKMEAWTGIEPV